MRFFQLNFELEPVAAIPLASPAMTPADQFVRPGSKVKICLCASWLRTFDEPPETGPRTTSLLRRRCNLDRVGTESQDDWLTGELVRARKSRSRQTDRDRPVARFRKSNGIALLFEGAVHQIHGRVAEELRHKYVYRLIEDRLRISILLHDTALHDDRPRAER